MLIKLLKPACFAAKTAEMKQNIVPGLLSEIKNRYKYENIHIQGNMTGNTCYRDKSCSGAELGGEPQTVPFPPYPGAQLLPIGGPLTPSLPLWLLKETVAD